MASSHEEVLQVDEQDLQTPDYWIPRLKSLIRLTGKHPLNAESPSSSLIESGLITPSPLHYVRNHSSVPKLDWKTHKVSVSGLVTSPHEFTMDELAQMPSITIPVTLSCDGNRRKEINMIKRTKGFNWGCGAVSTAVWKGVPLRDVLLKCGVKEDEERTLYVCFDGSDELAKGSYGTSIPLGVAMDTTNDILLAYEMNHERLPPDHGFPVRVIIPGYVGGRQVKWLKSIEVSTNESKSWYHYHDNRVLPSFVEQGTADSGRWWEKPEYILYELCINSAITHPKHEEWIDIGDSASSKYLVRGFAYTGGGRKITRVEISFDEGDNWAICELEFPTNALRHGYKNWAWCHWKLNVDVWKFLRAKNIIVRAWDSSSNKQPEKPTWNVLGMMNNCWYKVAVDVQPSNGKPSLVFKHPVQPGSLTGGWMMNKANEPIPSFVPSPGSILKRRLITREEVAKHNTKDDCWIIIDGRVFDVTAYFKDHPGGPNPLLVYAGKDATKDFHEIHSHDVEDMKEMFCIGILEDFVDRPKKIDNLALLNPRKWIDITLVERTEISHDTIRFRFQLPDKNATVGLPVGQHVLIAAEIAEHLIIRPYTPIRPVGDIDDDGHIELLVKIYRAGASPVFPQGGVMSQFLERLNLGDKVKVKGPAGHILYHGRGFFTVNGRSFRVKHVSMIAGGSGITPMFPLIKAVLNDPEDITELSLIYSNRTADDILLRGELEELAKSKRFKLWYTVATPPKDWSYSVGYVSEHMFQQHLFSADSESATFLCGPPAMIEQTCKPALERLGYTEYNLIEF